MAQIIQGGNVVGDNSQGFQQGIATLAQILANAAQRKQTQQQIAQNAETLALTKQRDAMDRFEKFPSAILQLAVNSGQSPEQFLKSNEGSAIINEAMRTYSEATGNQFTQEQAGQFATQFIENINKWTSQKLRTWVALNSPEAASLESVSPDNPKNTSTGSANPQTQASTTTTPTVSPTPTTPGVSGAVAPIPKTVGGAVEAPASVGTVPNMQTGLPQQTVTPEIASRIKYFVAMTGTDPNADIGALSAATSTWFQNDKDGSKAQGYADFLKSSSGNPPSSPVVGGPLETPKVTEPTYDEKRKYFYFNNQSSKFTPYSPNEKTAVEDFYSKNKSGYQSWSTKSKGSSSLEPNLQNVEGTVPVVVSDSKGMPTTQMVNTAQMLQVISDKLNLTGGSTQTTSPPLDEKKQDAVQVLTSESTGTSTKEQLAQRQAQAVANNWINATWAKMSSAQRTEAAQKAMQYLTESPPEVLAITEGDNMASIRLQAAMNDAQIKTAALNAMAAAAKDPQLQQLVEYSKNSWDNYNTLKKDAEEAAFKSGSKNLTDFFTGTEYGKKLDTELRAALQKAIEADQKLNGTQSPFSGWDWQQVPNLLIFKKWQFVPSTTQITAPTTGSTTQVTDPNAQKRADAMSSILGTK